MTAKLILCTGANQGLGFGVLQVAGNRFPESTYILGSRDLEKGKEAAAKLKESGITAKIDVVQLDVTNDTQIANAVAFVEKTYGKLDVLINNAGIIKRAPQGDLAGIRITYSEILNTNITSVAVMTEAFTPLLYKSKDPKVINVSSGLGSIQNSLTKKMGRSPPYGSSKIGLNGLTVHMQVAENDRIEAGNDDPEKPLIRFYACAPGVLKTSFTNYIARGRSQEEGAEVIVRLLADDDYTYKGGSYWEFEGGEMREVPW
ncbi:NAD(P)-binding protein [Mollisia scopiformis]|uniref:NAD(P)-binding protein n=1 Tax=Mollisia scopiformis TaxID=149040 RepID=A0A194X1K9_MOLSC|nr:NAD(P)-binding protein [Mollisia scopiformis]KUJ14081.1 NAD(P)-binding protein [Mollisia scopiformis]